MSVQIVSFNYSRFFILVFLTNGVYILLHMAQHPRAILAHVIQNRIPSLDLLYLVWNMSCRVVKEPRVARRKLTTTNQALNDCPME